MSGARRRPTLLEWVSIVTPLLFAFALATRWDWPFARGGQAWRVAVERGEVIVDNEPQRELEQRAIDAARARWEAEARDGPQRLAELKLAALRAGRDAKERARLMREWDALYEKTHAMTAPAWRQAKVSAVSQFRMPVYPLMIPA